MVIFPTELSRVKDHHDKTSVININKKMKYFSYFLDFTKMSFDQFVLHWISKNLKISTYSPSDIEKSILKYTKELKENKDLPAMLEKFKNFNTTLDIEQKNFWIESKQEQNPIIHTIEQLKAKLLLKKTKNILILAGAGMSTESGLPIFASGAVLTDINNKHDEIRELFSSHTPHEGYYNLLNFVGDNYYVVTSNIDGYFLRAGFNKDRIIEIHGNIYNNQCCGEVYNRLQKCPKCGDNMRLNVLSFGDENWIDNSKKNEDNMNSWIKNNIDDGILIIEIGAGIHIPAIRDYSELLVEQYGMGLIRVNPENYDISNKLLRLKCKKNNILLTSRLQMKAIAFTQFIQ